MNKMQNELNISCSLKANKLLLNSSQPVVCVAENSSHFPSETNICISLPFIFYRHNRKRKKNLKPGGFNSLAPERYIVETLYSTIYYSKYFTELNFDKSTQYVAL